MNNLYQWQDERMTELEMHQVRQEMEHVRMLRVAGSIGDGRLIKAGRALVNFLAAGWEKIRSCRAVQRPSRKSGSKKFA